MTSFEYMKKDIVLAKVIIYDDNNVEVINYTDDIIDRPFGTCTSPTRKDVDELYEERCFPRSRVNAKMVLSGKLYGYEPYKIVRDTHGILIDDNYWLRFDDEKDLCWNDVKEWKYHIK